MTLQEAIISKNLCAVKDLLINDPNLINEPYEGRSLSYLAAKTGDFAIFKYIVEYSRASFNEVDEKGQSVLFPAVTTDNLELVKYIVERLGFSALAPDYTLKTPYDAAIECKSNRVVSYFYEKYGDIDSMYRNPVRTGMHPDPSVVRVGDDFYMVNSSFIYFPCIPISHSKDLIHWEVIGHAITNPQWAGLDELEGGRGYWAPDISYHNGRFYITATYRLNDVPPVYRRQMIVSSENPEGPYSKPVFIEEDGIDPSLFTDDDGKRYMLLNRGARIFEINENLEQISEATLLYYGSNKRAPEGSHLLKKDGFYYLFQAEGGTGEGHMITVARSRELFGVYEPCPFNPIMHQPNSCAAIRRCGHGKPVSTPDGEWYIPYLCGRQIDGKYTILGRETALDKITWTADGWPMINNLHGPSALAIMPKCARSHQKKQATDTETTDVSLLCGDLLSKNYSWVRVPSSNAYIIKDKTFYLLAGEKPMSTMYSKNILVMAQDSFKFEYNACILLDKFSAKANVVSENGGQTGITCYYDENSYLTFNVVNEMGKLSLEVNEHIETKDIRHKIATLDIIEDDDNSRINSYIYSKKYTKIYSKVYLKVCCDKLARSFYYSFDGENYTPGPVLDNVYYLSDEGVKKGKRFTGAMVGIYAYRPESDNGLKAYGIFEDVRYLAL